MTSRERLERLYRHQEVDRPGIVARGVDALVPAHPSYAGLRRYAMEHADIEDGWYVASLTSGKRAHAPLLARVLPDRVGIRREPVDDRYDRETVTLATPLGPLDEVTMVGRGVPPYTMKHFIASTADAERFLAMPEQPYHLDASSYFAKVAALGDRGIVVVKPLGSNPAGAVAVLLGSETFALWSVEHRPLLVQLIDCQARFQLKIVKELLAKGIGPFYGLSGQEYLTPPLHGAKDFAEFNTAFDRPLADLIHEAGGVLFVHCHGKLSAVLDSFVGIADVLHPIEPPPMGDVTARQAAEAFRGRVCIEGNLQIGDFYTKSPAEIGAMTRELVRDAFADRRNLIVCPSASPFVATEGERAFATYRAMIDAVLGEPGRSSGS